MGKDGVFVPAPQEACLPLEKLEWKDARVLLVWIVAGILGAGVAYSYFFRAFPEASVEFKVPREAEAFAERFDGQANGRLGAHLEEESALSPLGAVS